MIEATVQVENDEGWGEQAHYGGGQTGPQICASSKIGS